MNIAHRAGRWSAAHWKTATLVWLAVVLCAMVGGRLAGTVNLTDAEQGTGQSALAQRLLNRSGFHNHASESVLIQSRKLSASDREFRREIEATISALGRLKQVDALRSPWPRATPARSRRTATRRSWSSTCVVTPILRAIAYSRC